MQTDAITELLSIPKYKVTHMVKNSEIRMDFLLERIKDITPVCSGCGRIHDTPIRSLGSITVEDLPISGKRVFLHVPTRKLPPIEDGRIRVEELRRIT